MTDQKTMRDFAVSTYGEIAYDLPRYGQGHFVSAHDIVADRLFDEFHASNPNADFRKIAKQALAGSVYDDRKETRSNEAKARRREAAALRPPKVHKVKARSPYGHNGITRGFRKGIGSY